MVFHFQVFKKLTTFFKSLGVRAVFDTSSSRDLTLIESCNEFITRYNQSQFVGDESCKSLLPMISSACPGMSAIQPLFRNSIKFQLFWPIYTFNRINMEYVIGH